jgi:serpin B
MSTRVLLLIVTVLACGSGCGSEDPVAPTPAPASVNIAKSELARTSAPSNANVARLVAANRALAYDLFHELIKTNPGQNIVVSPHSVFASLAMAYAGAHAQTAEQLRTALRFDLEQPELHEAFNALDLMLTPIEPAEGLGFQLSVKDSLWAQRDVAVEPTYLDTLALHYGKSVFLTDFAANPPDPVSRSTTGSPTKQPSSCRRSYWITTWVQRHNSHS